MKANGVIVYASDAFNANRKKVMGRHVAGASFLEGFGRHADVERIFGMTLGPTATQTFRDAIEQSFARRTAAGRPDVLTVRSGDYETVGRVGAIFTPDPGLLQHAIYRRYIGQRAFSVTGITHTVSSHAAMDAIGSYLTGPLQSWDALICTSASVVSVVRRILDARAEFLAERVGARPDPMVQTPVIPLGVDAAKFDALGAQEKNRKALRERLGVAPEDVVILFFGRLAMHAKAHPDPMLRAAQVAAERLKKVDGPGQGRRLHFVFTGQFASDQIEEGYLALPESVCPDVPVHFLDGHDRALADSSWAAADIFMSLSDNIQESFGITPVEAMAAGLPCVVSDWDGYKDTVVDGVTGFRIPCIAPPDGAGQSIARAYERGTLTYDRYIGYASQLTAVSVQSAADAIFELTSDTDLRARMGQAGRRRAAQTFDWSAIIPLYQELWADLADRRAKAEELAPVIPGRANPERLDPFHLFEAHPTRTLRLTDQVRLVDSSRVGDLLANSINNFALEIMDHGKSVDAVISLLEQAGQSGIPVRECLSGVVGCEPVVTIRTILWLFKYGVVEIEGA